MIFSTPLAALGFLTAVGLTAVYCFRRKSPPKTIGSLLLWPKTKVASAAARRRDRLRVPPIFWLELFILLALVTAALSPLVWRRSAGTLHVLRDTSPSMTAHDSAARHRADAFLAREQKRATKDAIFVRDATDPEGFRRELAAMRSVLIPGDEILVLTDQAPQEELHEDGLRWEAFGRPDVNYAITALRRLRKSPTEDSLFLEIRRFGQGADSVPLTIDGRGTTSVPFDANGRARFATTVPSASGTLTARLPDDALTADNVVTIPPPNVPSVTAAILIRSEARRELVRRALDATGYVSAYVAPGEASFIVTDRDCTKEISPDAYCVRFHESGARRTTGPVWTDPGEPLLEGITLAGDPYSLSPETLPGTPIAFLGDKPLVSAQSNACHLAFSDSRLPFFRSPAFPALIQNALTTAWTHLPPPEQPASPPATNLLSSVESDLTSCTAVSLGSRASVPEDARRTHSIAWIPGLLALLGLLVHFHFVRRRLTLVIIALTLLALMRPIYPKADRHGAIVVIADRSRSMPREALREQEKIVAELARTRPADCELGLVTFGANACLEQRPAPRAVGEWIQDVNPDGSDIAAALAKAEAALEPDQPARLLALSDGLFTVPPDRVKRPVDTLLQTRPFAHDLSVSRVDAPPLVSPNAVIPMTAWIQVTETTTNSYQLLRGTHVLAQGKRVFREGLSPLVFRDFASRPGLRRYTLVVTPSADDPCPENNRAQFLVKTEGSRPLLVLTDGAASPTAATLQANGIPVTEKTAADFPASLAALEDYAGVLLENVPAKRFAPSFLRDLAASVTDLGRGLALTGGESSFGPGGWYKTPVEDVLPVSLELRQDHRKYSLALAIVMDRSGSMACPTSDGRTKMEMANLGAAGAIDMLSAMDEVAVIAVDSQPHLILEMQAGDEAQSKRSRILGIQSMGGGIFVEEGIMAGLRELQKANTSIKHLILFADAADSEEPGDYEKYLRRATADGISVSVIALGSEQDCDAELLKNIAKLGHGECWFEQNAQEIPRLFMQDTYLTAKTAMCTNVTPLKVHAPLRQLSDTLPSELPNIGGYNLTYLREGSELAVSTADEENAPILSFRRAGLGRTLAYAGELSGSHAAPLMTSPQGAELTAALARWVREDDKLTVAGFQFERRVTAGGIRVTAVADEDNPLTAIPNSGLPMIVVKEQEGRGAEKTQAMLQWESASTLAAFIPLAGDEIAFPVVVLPDGSPVTLPPVCLPQPAEYQRPHDPHAGSRALEKLSVQTSGSVRASLEGLWESLPVLRRAVELAPFLFLLGACAFLTLVFLRRLGWELKWHLKSPHPPKRGARPRPPQQRSDHPHPPQQEGGSPQPPSDCNPSSLQSAFARAKRRAGTNERNPTSFASQEKSGVEK